MAQWILSCKELNGKVYVSRLPRTIPPPMPGAHPKPGIPSAWIPVGPGLRPTVQHYSPGGPNAFLLTFEYLSHTVCRVIPDIDATWPPTVVDPVTFSPTSIQMPEEAMSIKLATTAAVGEASYYFNPIVLQNTSLTFDPFTSTYSVQIIAVPGWLPRRTAGVTPFYRVYRRPLTGGPWVMRLDWNTVLNFIDTQVGSPFQWEYVATWGDLFDPAFPNDASRHNEGIIGDVDGSHLFFDSTVQSLNYALSPNEAMKLGNQTSAYVYAEANQLFIVRGPSDEISLEKARLEDSSLAAPCNAEGFIGFVAVQGSDKEQFPVGPAFPQSNAAPAGMYT